MLEWYRAEQTYDVVMRDCGEILKLAAAEIGDTRLFRFRGREATSQLNAERISVAEAFRQFAAIDLLETHRPRGQSGPGCFRPRCGGRGDQDRGRTTAGAIFSAVY